MRSFCTCLWLLWTLFQPHSDFNRVRWATGQEMNLIYFQVERRSPGGEWRIVSPVVWAKRLNEPRGARYKFDDHRAKCGVRYAYRVHARGWVGGHEEYSPVVWGGFACPPKPAPTPPPR